RSSDLCSFNVEAPEFAAYFRSWQDLKAAYDSPFTIEAMSALYKSANPLRTQSMGLPKEWVSDNTSTGFHIMLYNSDFWPEFLDVPHATPPGVTLEEHIHDYEFVKDVFQTVDADLCIGSHRGE